MYRLARRLDAALAGSVLAVGQLRVPAHATADLAGQVVTGHDTHGKHLLTRLSGPAGELTLHTHLRMSGSWTVIRAGRRLPGRVQHSVRVALEADGGSTAYGLDLPVVDLIRTSEERRAVGHLGPDPLRPDWSAPAAVALLVEAAAALPGLGLAEALLDQRLIAGLGNLWANELCFLRGHSPWTPVGGVDVPALVDLAARALRHSAFVPGAYQVTTGNPARGQRHWVTGRAGRPCLRCGTAIRVAAEGATGPRSRRTWWCPRCQPGPRP